MVIDAKKVLDCGHTPTPDAGIGTGYAETPGGTTLCYACAGERDAENLRTGNPERVGLYVTTEGSSGPHTIKAGPRAGQQFVIPPHSVGVNNWCGTIPKGTISISSWRTHADGKGISIWFEAGGHRYVGINRGDSDILHARKTSNT